MENRLEQFRANNKIQSAKYRKLVSNKFLFNLFLMKSLPMGFLAGLAVKSFDEKKCEITVPYRWLNQNPFSSTYFAVLAMAAEMSSGMISLMHTNKSNPSVSMLVTKLEAEFIKKATTITTFTCEEGDAILKTIEESVLTGEATSIVCSAVGRSSSGEIEAKFLVTWSFKARKPKD
jgi:hypothetical protein